MGGVTYQMGGVTVTGGMERLEPILSEDGTSKQSIQVSRQACRCIVKHLSERLAKLMCHKVVSNNKYLIGYTLNLLC